MEEARLIRFVAGPDGQVVPDLARKLPGRGMWVAADRASVTAAAKKGLFARSAKAKIGAPADLADQVETLLKSPAFIGPGACAARRRSYLGLRKGSCGDRFGQGRVADRGARTAPPTAAENCRPWPGSRPARPA